MIFNSLEFIIFFLFFFFAYWFLFKKKVTQQNLFLLLGCYVFYAWWDWRFLLLLIGSSGINFVLGLLIFKENNYKSFYLYSGILIGIGILWFFKYYNFFIVSFTDLLKTLGINTNMHTLNLILPLGISFYTFRTISYLLDVSSGKIKPTNNWTTFFTYIAFFPSLLSGPIDKARDFIPLLEKKRNFSHEIGTNGLRQILWGVFKKVVIADNCAVVTDEIFASYINFSGIDLIIGAFFFTIQVYADFSGYTDMAIGVAKLLGFRITKNFDFPFFSQNIAEFWRKWHISLTSWMTEYVFTPLSFLLRGMGKVGLIFAVLINFVIIGIWHGANWTYILFGLLNGLYFIPLILRGNLLETPSGNESTIFSRVKVFLKIIFTFTLVMFTNIIFRSENITDAYEYLLRIFTTPYTSFPQVRPRTLTILIICFMLIEWIGRKEDFAIAKTLLKKNIVLRWSFYMCIVFCTVIYSVSNKEFIYFQF